MLFILVAPSFFHFRYNFLNWVLFVAGILFISACGGGGGEVENSEASISTTSLNLVRDYAQNGGKAPNKEDYISAGVTGINTNVQREGKRWLDRNLGAKNVCAKKDEIKESKEDEETAKGIFYYTTIGNYDWAIHLDDDGSKRRAKWSKTDGSSICPKGLQGAYH